jgi:hypothetical protein
VLDLTPTLPPRTLIGRDSELVQLTAHVERQGLTVVTGRPQIGKSRLLEALDERLGARGALVGRTEASGQESDSLLRAVADAYSRWLRRSTWKDQAQSLIDRFGAQGSSLGLQLVTRLLGKGSGIKVADEIFTILWNVRDALEKPLTAFTRLDSDQALSLVSTLTRTSEQPVVLILDGLDQSQDPAAEGRALAFILRRIHEWPASFHILVGLRHSGNDDTSVKILQSLRSFPASKELRLERLELAQQAEERQRAVDLVRAWVPGAKTLGDEEILEALAGYPGTLARWLAERPRTAGQLRQLAEEAQKYHYPELDLLLRACLADERKRRFVLRLALLPEVTSLDSWVYLGPVALQSRDDTLVTDLQSDGVLDVARAYPSFGHTGRYHAAQQWCLEAPEALPYTRQEAADTVLQLCAGVRPFSTDDAPAAAALAYRPVVAALAYLGPKLAQLPRLEGAEALCRASATLLDPDSPPVPQEVLVRVCEFGEKHRETVPIVAALLRNAQVHASRRKDFATRDTLLTRLIGLLQSSPLDVIAQSQLIRAIFDAVNAAIEIDAPAERDKHLDSLRLMATGLTDPPARRFLARALVNVRVSARGDAATRNALLEELREIAHTVPDDEFVRESLATALVATSDDERPEMRPAHL